MLIAQGENLKYVSRQLGHASIQLTADIYGHLFKETSQQAMRRLNKILPAPAGKTTEAARSASTAKRSRRTRRLRAVA